VDNGAIRFSHVRVPRTALLDRFGCVDRSGRYSSPLPSAPRRFAATLGELTGGRVGLVSGSVGVAKLAVTIAVRYCAQRQQFGPPGAPEVAVLAYQVKKVGHLVCDGWGGGGDKKRVYVCVCGGKRRGG
jgi:acyl-CoA oxidase